MHRFDLLHQLNTLLEPERFRDYAPNGLQVEGHDEVCYVVTGVTASLALIEAAIERGADTILVHHGYFWKGEESRIIGTKRQRLKRLLEHDINLISYHLPLDAHPEVGNNAQLAKLLGWQSSGVYCGEQNLVWLGHCAPVRAAELVEDVEQALQRRPILLGSPDKTIRSVAWCSGGADSYFQTAIDAGVDLFLTGEISEPCQHLALETGVNFIAAGHHATERGGIRALGEWINQHTAVRCEFIDVNNPA